VGSGETGQWWSRLTDGDFTRTPFSLLGLGSGWISILPFLAAILLGSATAGRAWLVPRSPRVVVEAATAFICWLVVAVCGPAILSQSPGTGGAILALVMLAAALCAIAIGVYRLPVVADDVVAASAGRARRQTEAPSAGATALLAPPATRVGEASGVALDEPGTQVAGVTAAEREAAVPELSAVVLCYRAGEALVSVVEPLHEQLVASGTPFELVLVANYWEGSDDETPAVARAFAEGHARVRVVAKPKEGRMGWDMLSGLDAARGAFLVVIDGDAQNPVEDVLRLHGVMAATGAPVAKGRRIRRGDGAYRSAVSAFYNALFLLLFRTSGIWDINGKPKGLTREAYERIRPELQSTDWFTDAEIVLTAHRLGLPIAEMPVRFLPSTRPSLVGPGTIVEFVVNILRYRFGSRQRR